MTTISYEHHTHGDTPQTPARRPARATSCDRLRTPGKGLRRNETRMLDAADFGRNPDGGEFGEFGLCRVRFGKAKKGSPPKRRTVLTVFGWTPDILEEWFTE